MKPFWLFSGSVYYPGGGMKDFQGSFDTLEAAKAAFSDEYGEDAFVWAHVWHDDAIVIEYFREKWRKV